MTEQDRKQTESAAWFLKSEDGEPLGQLYRSGDCAVPTTGQVLTDGASWQRAVVVQFHELRSSCLVRRFEVIVRVVE